MKLTMNQSNPFSVQLNCSNKGSLLLFGSGGAGVMTFVLFETFSAVLYGGNLQQLHSFH